MVERSVSNSDSTKMGLSYIKRYALLSVVAWSVIVSALLLWNAIQTKKETHDYAHIYTNAAFEKDILYRRWATMHGGVYVPVTDKTPPNPYLSSIPERDRTTPSGRRLTLMNPAYMTRQVYEFERDVSAARSHLERRIFRVLFTLVWLTAKWCCFTLLSRSRRVHPGRI